MFNNDPNAEACDACLPDRQASKGASGTGAGIKKTTGYNLYLCADFFKMNILMVCLGNICRSPLAEGIMQDKIQQANLTWKVDSAGTNGYHVGEAPHRLSQKVAAMHGIDISKQRARNISPGDFEKFDIIYAMADDVIDEIKWRAGKQYNATKVKLLMNEVYPGRNMDVPDPWYGTETGYHEVYDMINKACDKIIENIQYKK